jgi:hypothetical protein
MNTFTSENELDKSKTYYQLIYSMEIIVDFSLTPLSWFSLGRKEKHSEKITITTQVKSNVPQSLKSLFHTEDFSLLNENKTKVIDILLQIAHSNCKNILSKKYGKKYNESSYEIKSISAKSNGNIITVN